MTYISVFAPSQKRPLYYSLAGFCWGVGCILGPVIGGAFAGSNATWRWAFYINLVLAAVSAPIYILFFPRSDPQPTLSAKEKWRKVDLVGGFLKAALISLLMIVLSFAGSTWNWQSGGTIALWVLFGLSVIAFAVQQTFTIFTTREHRLFPVQFLKSRSLILIYFGTSAAGAGLFMTIYYVPLFFQFTKGDTAIEAAVRLLPFIMVAIFCIMLSGALLPKFAWYNVWYLMSGICIIIGSSFMFKVTQTTHPAAIYGFEIITAVGTGLSCQIGYSLAPAIVKPHEIPHAIGFINVAQIGGVAIALSISGSIFQNLGFQRLQDALAPYNFAESEIRSALAGAQSAILSHGSDEVKALALASVTSTISSIYGLLIAAGVLMVISAVLMRRERLQLTQSVPGG
jgi:MFS family permease